MKKTIYSIFTLIYYTKIIINIAANLIFILNVFCKNIFFIVFKVFLKEN